MNDALSWLLILLALLAGLYLLAMLLPRARGRQLSKLQTKKSTVEQLQAQLQPYVNEMRLYIKNERLFIAKANTVCAIIMLDDKAVMSHRQLDGVMIISLPSDYRQHHLVELATKIRTL